MHGKTDAQYDTHSYSFVILGIEFNVVRM